jgi:hypothetical protein
MRPPPKTDNDELDTWLKELWEYVNRGIPLVFKETLADDASIDLPASVQGWGVVFAGDFAEWAFFKNTAAAVVTAIVDTNGDTLNSANMAATDTDAKLCIFDNGTNVRVRNRLGSTQEIFIMYYYYP